MRGGRGGVQKEINKEGQKFPPRLKLILKRE
jgi:hypothetical protein